MQSLAECKIQYGSRNNNLLEFVCLNDLYVTDSRFEYPSRHRPAHIARVMPNIDYILCRSLLQNAWSLGGIKQLRPQVSNWELLKSIPHNSAMCFVVDDNNILPGKRGQTWHEFY